MINTATDQSLLFFFFMTFLFCPSSAAPVDDRANKGGVIMGSVVDQRTSKPIEFATVMVHAGQNNTLVTGVVSDASGKFRIDGLQNGTYYVKVSFIGFETFKSKNVVISNSSVIELGRIMLINKDIEMQDVVVKADKAPISYQIDKKVISVSGNITATSGTAVDVLENVPSVTVDIDGNVSLRGSANFTVLIDGRPTIMDGNTVLQQIPATAIENIEIITNPSAKYDPEGTAGIINIIQKKNTSNGVSGIAGINAGAKEKYGAEMLTDYKNKNIQLNFGLNYNKRTMTSTENGRNWTNDGSLISFYNSEGSSFRQGEHFGVRGSVGYDFGDERILNVGGKYSSRRSLENTLANYSEWTSVNSARKYSVSRNDGNRSGGEYQLTASYNHPFNNEGHELSIELDYEAEDGTDETTNNLISGLIITDGKKASESGPGDELTSKIDYKFPFGEGSALEAGYQGELQMSNEITSLDMYDPVTAVFVRNPLFSNDIKYYTNQYALYSIYSGTISEFGFKIGVREEYTGREVKINAKGQNFSMDKWDIFPTAHFSLDLGSGNQVMTSYTKRINRPHGWEFEPFLTWIDAYNVRIGNPSILPENIDSYELGYQKIIGSTLLSLDSYYRITNNKIDRIRSFYSENVTLQTPQNIGKDYALGAEAFTNFDPVEKWNVNLMGNLYKYTIAGTLNGADLNRNSFNWNIRFNNTLKLGSETTIQLNAMYNSPTVSAQGRREGYVSTNIAVKQSLFERLLTATLQIRDLFSASTNETVSESFDFYNYRYSRRESPVIMLNLRFNINNYQMDENEGRDDSGGNESGQ
ncbi:MAG: TonB-dependent receptor domain-containing protein [Bacteroidota bacterium]